MNILSSFTVVPVEQTDERNFIESAESFGYATKQVVYHDDTGEHPAVLLIGAVDAEPVDDLLDQHNLRTKVAVDANRHASLWQGGALMGYGRWVTCLPSQSMVYDYATGRHYRIDNEH